MLINLLYTYKVQKKFSQDLNGAIRDSSMKKYTFLLGTIECLGYGNSVIDLTYSTATA